MLLTGTSMVGAAARAVDAGVRARVSTVAIEKPSAASAENKRDAVSLYIGLAGVGIF